MVELLQGVLDFCVIPFRVLDNAFIMAPFALVAAGAICALVWSALGYEP